MPTGKLTQPRSGKARGDGRKADLAQKISNALKVHTKIEEEIFYLAFSKAA